jgi:hypothetical protein
MYAGCSGSLILNGSLLGTGHYTSNPETVLPTRIACVMGIFHHLAKGLAGTNLSSLLATAQKLSRSKQEKGAPEPQSGMPARHPKFSMLARCEPQNLSYGVIS